ncbi:MAG: glycoside hydrolase family 130 protein [Firmicutes bacterium]|nr:glycoside hydrolase family 130 protein [Bacillota bacterium]
MYKQPLARHPQNPILTPDKMPFRCYTVMNSGAIMFNGNVLLLLRVEYCDRTTHFHTAVSSDGVNFTVSEAEIDYPLSETERNCGAAHRFDMRATPMDGTFYITHAAWLPGTLGCCVGMATTDDFVHFKPLPYLSEPSNRNCVLFPEKINGLYARIDRPQDVDGKGGMWVSYSPDLMFWGKSMPILLPSTPWYQNKCGAAGIPIKTDEGWLQIYHATANTCSSENYYLGAMLLDLNEPNKIIRAPREFILAAEKDYECVGQTPNVVFSNGHVVLPDGTLNVYYGGADTRMCLAQTTVKDLVDYCKYNR